LRVAQFVSFRADLVGKSASALPVVGETDLSVRVVAVTTAKPTGVRTHGSNFCSRLKKAEVHKECGKEGFSNDAQHYVKLERQEMSEYVVLKAFLY
jgi:hypothetical protein